MPSSKTPTPVLLKVDGRANANASVAAHDRFASCRPQKLLPVTLTHHAASSLYS
jgi:hypothetical protein